MTLVFFFLRYDCSSLFRLRKSNTNQYPVETVKNKLHVDFESINEETSRVDQTN